MLTYIWLLF